MQPAVYINFIKDSLLLSMATGGTLMQVATPQKYWGLGLNLAEITVGIRLSNMSANTGVTVNWQWSLDGVVWQDGTAAMIAEKTATGDYVGTLSTTNELLPFGRVLIAVRDTTGSTQKSVVVSAWGYYKFRA